MKWTEKGREQRGKEKTRTKLRLKKPGKRRLCRKRGINTITGATGSTGSEPHTQPIKSGDLFLRLQMQLLLRIRGIILKEIMSVLEMWQEVEGKKNSALTEF